MTEVIQTDIKKPINNIEDTFDCLQERLNAAEIGSNRDHIISLMEYNCENKK